MQKDKDDDCYISIVQTLPYHVGSRRLFSCTQQSSRVNVRATSAENNVPDTFVEKSVPTTKDLLDSPNNLDVPENILNDISMDITDLPDVPQMISSKNGNGTHSPCSPKPCEVPTEDENRTVQDVPDCDRNESSVHKSISSHKGSKHLSVRNQGPRRADLKRNVGPDGKKKKDTSNDLVDISYRKFSQRKQKKLRLISELIHIKIGGSADAIEGGSSDAIEADHSKTGDICESGKSKMSLEAEKDNDTPISNQKVCEIQSSEVKNKAKPRGLDNANDGSSLMSWLRKTHKKVRTGKRNSRHENFDSSFVSNSNPDRLSSRDMCHDSVPSVGDLGQKNVLPTTSQAHNGNENTHNNNLEENMQKEDGLCQNESENLKQRFLSNGESMIFLKRKVLSPAISCDKNTENSTIKGSMIRTDDLGQMESEGTVQRCLKKISLGKCKIQNVSGLHKQNIPKNRKKRGLEVHEKQTAIDDIPMDIVELLARNQHQRQLMTNNDSLGNNHTQSNIAAVDCVEITKDGPIDALTVLDTNFKKSSASESKRKYLHGRASSNTEATNVRMKGLHMQESSQCHAASNTEIPNSHRPEHHIPDILECTTQEQQTHFNRDEEVTIACTSPIFSHPQHIAEVPTQTWSNKGEKKFMWDSFKTASRNSPASTYGFQFRSRIREDSTPIPVHGASNDYATHQPEIVAVDQYTKEADNQVQSRSVPSTTLTMEVGGPYNERIIGHSSFYPKEPMPATHVPRLVDSSTSRGFTNYPRRKMELETQNLGSQYGQHNQYKASPSTSYGGQIPLTLQDLRHQVEKNLHRPLRPRPRVGVFGSLLQQDIASWSENCGTTSFDMNREGNNEALNSGMSSAGCPLDLLVRKDICQTNRNPADFTVIGNENEYMINL
ncbi:unnamed protein product [Urochloa decumbens]|uniref:Uncharacterized protein n=1 Tax=Urochloa decumbens TaxID=240449 RepID=A0ABC9CBC6_9POAL